MGQEYQEIDERIQRWIERQRMFFVSTAPLAGDGRINCSPKGLDSLRVPIFPDMPAIRNFIVVDIECIRDSCGYGVPLYEFKSERESLKNSCESKTTEELLEYRIERNALSLDGLPGLGVTPDQE